MMTEPLRLGFIQFTPSLGEPEENRQAILRLVAGAEADLLVLPELCLSGYLMGCREEALRLAEPANGPTTAALTDVCRREERHVIFGLAERDGERVYNSAVVVGPQGLVGVYRKTHLFLDELDWFSPGDRGFPVWDLGCARVGVLICFDWAFPEAARSLALAGADVIAHPANLVLPHGRKVMAVRAIENHVFTVTANRCGREDRDGRRLEFNGGSQVVAPDGQELAAASSQDDVVGVVEIHVARARDKRITPRNHLFNDRRPEYYRLG